VVSANVGLAHSLYAAWDPRCLRSLSLSAICSAGPSRETPLCGPERALRMRDFDDSLLAECRLITRSLISRRLGQ
jgi:hypothetical protein